jgi:phosphoenolpyruvate carboxylase
VRRSIKRKDALERDFVIPGMLLASYTRNDRARTAGTTHVDQNAVSPRHTTGTLLPLLLQQIDAARAHAATDPFGNPMLTVALFITRLLDHDEADFSALEDLVRTLRDQAFIDRARRVARYVGGTSIEANQAALTTLAGRLVRPDPNDSAVPFAQFRASVERTRFAAVFTAHPTFALPPAVNQALADAASSETPTAPDVASHRPGPITLEDEFQQARHAIEHGRDALDTLNAALLTAAADAWRDRWSQVVPHPVVLTSWVGYDTDGRTDINWWDTLRLRLRMKRLQLERLHRQLSALPGTQPLTDRIDIACAAVTAQIDAAPTTADPEAVSRFAHALVGRRDESLVTPAPLLEDFAAAIAAAAPEHKIALCVARAGLIGHGLSLAHTHVRLNSAQIHNVIRQRLNLSDPPEDLSRRRVLLSAINAALDEVQPIPVDFGSLLAEQASAAKLMMTVAQMVKHIDGSIPVRFLIAETESGYTLLAALWLARLFGIEDRIEISPLFETAEALEGGQRVLEEALRSPHYRAYLARTGRLCLQFGYSDSGRYVGQLAASYLIERLRMKIAETLKRHGVTGVEVVLFDTHGESIGRGAHPNALADRLKYLAPTVARRALAEAGVQVREESAFQGGDGYMLFGTQALALATIARVAEHAFATIPPPGTDPVYWDPDFAADFFATIGRNMQELVEDPGYAALLGAFGPALLDKTGSRPAARQTDGMGGPATIRHPSELRAIPNNAILQQLGWCANTLQGLGVAAARHPEAFLELIDGSPRFRRAIDLAAHALRHSDIDVLRAEIAMFEPTTWLDRAGHARFPHGRRQALMQVANGVTALGLGSISRAMFQRIQADYLALRGVWRDPPEMAAREALLHALRIALIGKIWLLETQIPDFAPRHGVTRAALQQRILRLDIPASLKLLADVFPAAADPAVDRDYAEPRPDRAAGAYKSEHAEIFEPMARAFALLREISTAVTHEVGAFG